MLRLFETGKREEDRLVRDLRRTGATVLDTDPETGRQWQVTALGGHFGGSLDAVAIGLLEAPKTWHVVEFKTHSAKSFATLKKDGVERAKPRHWAQMQVYMHLAGITRAMYVAVCKDTDEIHIERIHADRGEGERLVARASRVINAPCAAGADLGGSGLVAVPAVRSPRPLPRRQAGGNQLSDLPAFDADRGRVGLSAGPGANLRRPSHPPFARLRLVQGPQGGRRGVEANLQGEGRRCRQARPRRLCRRRMGREISGDRPVLAAKLVGSHPVLRVSRRCPPDHLHHG